MLRKLIHHTLILLLCSGLCVPVCAKDKAKPEIFYHNFDPKEFKKWRTYELDLILLALEKTTAEFGPYEMRPIGVEVAINQARSIALLKKHSYPNYVRSFGFQPDLTKKHKLDLVPFPLYLGAMSYRVCFTSEKMIDDIARTETSEDLKRYKFGTGIGWSDAAILRHNGFKVAEINGYESLFKMTSLNRGVDLFCRGSGEVEPEAQRYGNLEGLALDRSMAIYYPQPLFLYMNPTDKHGLDRLSKGLKLAYQDGTLQKLWQDRFEKSIMFADFKNRRIFRYENPFLNDLDIDIEKYNFLKYD